jgi:O-antigen/teichoic acid export membrane protein
MLNIVDNMVGEYKKLSAPVKASIWFAAANIIQKLIVFFCTPIYTSLLSTSEYGFYSVYSSWEGFLTVFITLNLASGTVYKALIKFEGDENNYISSMQGLTILMALCWLVVLTILYPFIGAVLDMEYWLLAVTVLSIGIYPAFSFWSLYQRFQYKYRMLVFANIGISIFVALLNIFLIFILSEKKYSLVISNVLVNGIVGIIFSIINAKKTHTFYRKSYWKYALRIHIPLVPSSLSATGLSQADRIMISNMCGQDKAGIYSLSYTVSMLMNIVLHAITNSFFPWTYKAIKDKRYSEINKYSFYILLVLGTATVGAVAIAPELVVFLGTEEYLEAKWIIAPVMLSVYFTMVSSFFGNVMIYFEKSIYTMITSIVAAVLNVILNYIFIPIVGYIVAGYTTLISYVIQTVLAYFFMRKICHDMKIEIIYKVKNIILFSCALIIICMGEMLLYDYGLIRICILIIILVMIIVKREYLKNIFSSFKTN